jgi:CheY-like chemotaxis protein/two-component sensor histidine kinase
MNMINDLLDLAKMEAGRAEVHLDKVSVSDTCQTLAALMKPMADKKELRLTAELADDLPIIVTDAGKLQQILYNLLSNAIKFTEEGRISVRVRKRRRREDPFEIAVEDTGIGIAPQHLDDIFKEFKQLDGAADRRYPGTGLGLTISKRLAELLGGEILVESEVGKGSTFTLRLPVRRHEEPALTPARKPLAAALAPPRLVSGRKQVLVIGADADAAQLAEAQAEQLGCEVSVCASGQEGPRRAAEMAPDAVVLDLAVPDRNGWEVLGELKSKEPTRDLPVVAVSGGDDRKRAFYLGASEFVAKPVEPEQFRSALARVLRPGRGRILVVDDEPEYLEAIREWLGDSVGEVCPARNGVEALRQLEARKPDAVFLDLMMPQMDGFELLKQIRSLEGCADIPVVVVTGKQLGEAELARIQDGATSVIQKGLTAQAQVMQQLERIVARLH